VPLMFCWFLKIVYCVGDVVGIRSRNIAERRKVLLRERRVNIHLDAGPRREDVTGRRCSSGRPVPSRPSRDAGGDLESNMPAMPGCGRSVPDR